MNNMMRENLIQGLNPTIALKDRFSLICSAN